MLVNLGQTMAAPVAFMLESLAFALMGKIGKRVTS